MSYLPCTFIGYFLQVTRVVHGAEGLGLALRATDALFGDTKLTDVAAGELETVRLYFPLKKNTHKG